MTQNPVNHFDRGKPFYPLVMNYVAQLIGFKELALRGIVGSPTIDELVSRIKISGAPPAGNATSAENLRSELEKLSGPLQLASVYQGTAITIDIDQVAREIVQNHLYLAGSMMKSAGSLLILAHEVSKDKPWHNACPIWEFLRHCRNAAAHGGRFNLLNGEPRRPAQWGNIVITSSLEGCSLFISAGIPGSISPGDPIRLLWDIEQEFPQMIA